MRLNKYLGGAAICAVLVAAPVGDALAFDWSGFHAGVIAGAISNDTTRTVILDDYDYDGAVYSGIYNLDGTSGMFGATIGYDYQSGNLVVGAEADYSVTNNAGSIDGLDWDDCCGAVGYELNGFGTIRARAGIAVDNMLFFVTGGLAFANYTAWQVDEYDSDNEYDVQKMRMGPTVGVGAEVGVTENITVKAEALIYDLGTDNYDYDYGEYADSAKGVVARAGLNFKF